MIWRPPLPSLLFLAAAASAAGQVRPSVAPAPKPSIVKERIEPQQQFDERLFRSQDGKHEARAICTDGREPDGGDFGATTAIFQFLCKDAKVAVARDGRAGKGYDQIWPPIVFSPDSLHLSYAAKDERGFVAVLDEREGPAFEYLGNSERAGYSNTIVFSPDSRRMAYVASREGERGGQFAVIDGRESKVYGRVGGVVFSENSRHVAYGGSMSCRDGYDPDAGCDGPRFAVVDGRRIPGEDVVFLGFEPKGEAFAYQAGKEGSEHRVVLSDGRTGPLVRRIEQFRFAPDGRHFAYLAGDEILGFRVFKDGTVVGEHHRIENGSIQVWNLTFSQDGRRLAYIVTTGTFEQFVVVDGHPQKRYNHVGLDTLVFSPDGRSLAYVASWQKEFVVLDCLEGAPHDHVEQLTFSADSRHLGCVTYEWIRMGTMGRANLSVDGREMPKEGSLSKLAFTPDSRSLTYVHATREGWFRVTEPVD